MPPRRRGNRIMDYDEFLKTKSQIGKSHGFKPVFMPDYLYDFQKVLVEWALLKGRGALFEDCGLGKTVQQLVWAENIVRKTNKKILIITPLAVSHQTVREGEKFGIECLRSEDGKARGKITVTNYERLHYFNSNDYIGVVCDESSILKNFDGKRKAIITEFLRLIPYRLACTATAAPNDYIELGTTSEALGELGYMDMLNRFFKNDNNTSALNRFHGQAKKWRFKKHAKTSFWKWVCSWARAIRKPSDIGFKDGQFILPPLIENQNIIDNTQPLPGELFVIPAIGLKEQREEMRMTLKDRCDKVAELVSQNGTHLIWCHLNAEGDLLEKIIPDSVQVSGSDSDNKKESRLMAFSEGKIKTLITKPKIAGFGLNWQHCSHMTFFPSHSFEQYYQGVRRCWRFGQKNPVIVDVVTTGGGLSVLANLQNKAKKADIMFSELVTYMNDSLNIELTEFEKEMETPAWL
ncbi:MAG TPA: helicase [Algoriphagus sp.]|nr:helicase [Algoriphagus sp.]